MQLFWGSAMFKPIFDDPGAQAIALTGVIPPLNDKMLKRARKIMARWMHRPAVLKAVRAANAGWSWPGAQTGGTGRAALHADLIHAAGQDLVAAFAGKRRGLRYLRVLDVYGTVVVAHEDGGGAGTPLPGIDAACESDPVERLALVSLSLSCPDTGVVIGVVEMAFDPRGFAPKSSGLKAE